MSVGHVGLHARRLKLLGDAGKEGELARPAGAFDQGGVVSGGEGHAVALQLVECPHGVAESSHLQAVGCHQQVGLAFGGHAAQQHLIHDVSQQVGPGVLQCAHLAGHTHTYRLCCISLSMMSW